MTTIASSLGAGSGIDIKALVESLSAAVKAPKESAIAKRETANQARISSLADVSASVSSFSAALTSLIRGGTLRKQLSVSEPSLAKISTIAGSSTSVTGFSLEVVGLAKAQTLQSDSLATKTSPVGQGSLTLTTAAGSKTITIDSSNDSLTGLAAAINGSLTGVTASVVTDSNGARLVLKGQVGAANAFTLSADAGSDPLLERFNYPSGGSSSMSLAIGAQDATVKIDGVQVTRGSNTITDLVDGLQIQLSNEKPGTIAQVAVSRPTEAITQALGDFVEAYNEVATKVSAALAAGTEGTSGALRGNSAVTEIRKQLSTLTSTKLVNDASGPQTLAEIGVRTNRDGTLSLDTVRLADMLGRFPDNVESFFNPKQFSSDPKVVIKSAPDKVKPGTYALTDLVAASGGASASGKVNGQAMIGVGTNLVAPQGSEALGLIVGIEPGSSSATITIEPGLAGALSMIKDSIQSPKGAVALAKAGFNNETKALSKEREKLEAQSMKYYSQLLQTFTAMDVRVSSFKATQSYLDQQIKAWTSSSN